MSTQRKGVTICADFETTTTEEDCRVWACGLYYMDSKKFECGNSIEWFFDKVSDLGDCTIYFHNLKFDGTFIIDWLFRNGFEHTTERKIYKNQFSTLISDKNLFYSIKLKMKSKSTITILDSLKIIPFSVKVIAKSFGLKIQKGEIDYSYPRPVGWKITDEEYNYIKNDCEIVGQALEQLFSQDLTQMTQGSNALSDFKSTLDRKFDLIFPPPVYDADIRQAYKGGFTYVNPKYQGRNIGHGVVYDKNSMYPSMMKFKPLPYDVGEHFEGKYIEDEFYPLYIQAFSCIFELKKDHLPTIQIKNGYMGFLPTEYVSSSNDEEITLCLTSVDLKLFLDHYNIIGEINWLGGWKFRAVVGLFDNYIDKWYRIKEESTRTGNKGMRTLAKLMLNALYGKFALNPHVQSKIPYFDKEENMIKYRLGEEEEREPLYLPVACFITAYSREDVIRNAQANFDRFIYADTDSLHLVGTQPPENMDIDDYRLGAWKQESRFIKARFLRAKCYIEFIPDKIPGKQARVKANNLRVGKFKKEKLYYAPAKVTCAGMPSSCHEYVTWDNFAVGASYPGKKRFKTVPGGAVLVETPFKIKENPLSP